LSACGVFVELPAAHPKRTPPTHYNARAALTRKRRLHRVKSFKAYRSVGTQYDIVSDGPGPDRVIPVPTASPIVWRRTC